ncbi:uncharacterized protein LOC131647909 isoform X3 [Vicia villosa]|uniref:uncharacterized protein LOC131647909 isoform X3 n=1 Tax=Vicia villosa TaxID=3911 RepID=UPI00273BAA5E|nr:uncharacterized protein LOC131647909 isoform X3 [Vicia villosa]
MAAARRDFVSEITPAKESWDVVVRVIRLCAKGRNIWILSIWHFYFLVGWETFMNVAFGWINVKDVANAHILANGHALDNGRYCLVERVIHFSKLKLMETNMGMLLYGRIISYLEFLSMKRDFLVRLCWRHAP